MTHLVLKKIEVHRFKGLGLGINFASETFFQNYESRDKVRWLSLTVMILVWSITFRYPIKIYGIRMIKEFK